MPAAYRGILLAAYHTAELQQGLSSSHTWTQSVRELEQILGDFEYLQKDTQAAVVEDVKLALGCQDSCVEQQEALARLLKTAKIVLPQKRWAAVDRLSRATGIDMARAGRKAAGQSQAGWQVDWLQLPQTALEALLQSLDPATLARALCCCTAWRQLGSHDAVWEPHLHRLFPAAAGSVIHLAGLPAHKEFAFRASREPLHRRQLWASHRYLKAGGHLCWGCSHADHHQKPQAEEVLDLLHDLSGRRMTDSDSDSDARSWSSDSCGAPCSTRAFGHEPQPLLQ